MHNADCAAAAKAAAVSASDADGPTLHNLIEPFGLIEHFLEHPPAGFSIVDLGHGIPAFSARFDLLTTVEPPVRRVIDALPFARVLRRLLAANTCFVGTTSSEYSLFPVNTSADELANQLATDIALRYPFLIIKDLPGDGVLVGEAAYAWSQELIEACRARGFVALEGQVLAYVPIDFASTDEFLMRRSHARRKNLRRKLKAAAGLRIEEIHCGDEVLSSRQLLARLYELYKNVYDQSEIHFDLLTEAFFRSVLQDATVGGIVFLYYEGAELIGFNLCFHKKSMLIDKYIGLAYPKARDHNLYAVSWFHNLEYALAHGLRYYVAGWTDPEVKRELGAEFTFTKHMVYVRNPFLRGLLRLLRHLFESDHARHGR
jgi:hypothetical protein